MNDNKEKCATIIFINKESKILMLLRDNIPAIRYPNKWDLIGGHFEKDETPEQCIRREVEEEIEIKLDNPKLFDVIDMEDRLEHMFWVRADFEIKDINLHEGQKLQWFSEEEIKNLPDDEIGFNFKPIILEFFRERIFEK